jgi:hypothetical protein
LHVLSHAALLRRCLSALDDPYTLRLRLQNTHAAAIQAQRGFSAFVAHNLPQKLNRNAGVPMAPQITTSKLVTRAAEHRLTFNADAVAIALALALAALIRLNVIHHISW